MRRVQRLLVLLAVPLAAGAVLLPHAPEAAGHALRWWRRAPVPRLGPVDGTASPLRPDPSATVRPLRPPDDLAAVDTWVSPDDVRALAWDASRGAVLAATSGGLLVVPAPPPGPGRCALPARGALRRLGVPELPSAVLHDVRVEGATTWIATEAGLVRRTPEGMRVLRAGLRDPRVTALARHAGRLYVGTAGGGLHRLEGERLVPLAPGHAGAEITALAAGPGGLWVGTPEGLLRWSEGRVERVADRWVTDLAFDGGRLVAAGPDGAVRLDPRTGERTALAADRAVWRLVRPAERLLFADLDGGLLDARGRALPGPGTAAVRDALAVGDAVWWATADGLVLSDAEGHLHPLRLSGLPQNELTAVAVVEGRVVVGGWDRGLAVRDGDGFRRVAPEVAQVNQLLAAGDGAVWAATAHGLYRVPLDGGPPRRWGRDRGLASDHVTAVARTGRGLVVATARGLTRLPSGVTLDARQGLPDAPLQSVAAGPGDRIVAGSLHGLVRLEGGRVDVVGPGDGRLPDGWVTAVAFDGATLWIGTYDAGLVRVTGDRWERLAVGIGGAAGRIHPGALAVVGDRLLAGTQGGGLLAVGPDGVRRYGVAEGLPSGEVTALAPDGDAVWVATRGGLARLRFARRAGGPS